jgi:histidine triad (HIT) family protein
MINEEQAVAIKKQLFEQLSKFPEEQVKALRQQLENASPEQLEKFISQQEGEEKCLFCEITSGNIETVKVFEDQAIFVMMDINPANIGHVMIIPKQHYQFIFQIPDEVLWDMVRTAKMIIPSLVNIVKAKGFNILISQGTAAQQRINHFSLNIIPRFDDDKINLGWERKNLLNEQKDVAKKLGEIFSKVAEEENAKKSKIEAKKEKREEKGSDVQKIDNEEKEKIAFFPRRMP